MAKKLPEVKKLSPNFADVFFVGKEDALGEDDSANIAVVREGGVPCDNWEKKNIKWEHFVDEVSKINYNFHLWKQGCLYAGNVCS